MNLYEFNQAMVSATMKRPLTKEKIKQRIRDIFLEDNFQKIRYTMLMCYELRDFTVFDFLRKQKRKEIAEEMTALLLERGDVVDINKTEDGNYEFWVKTKNNVKIDPNDPSDIHMYLLFNYDWGVIEV